MLHAFLAANRSELIDRCKVKAVLRPGRASAGTPIHHGIPQFLDQLIETLRAESEHDAVQSKAVSGLSGGAIREMSQIGETATLRGRELLLDGFTIDAVVHDYGDLCQAITELAFERNAPIATEEFHTLNRCLDNAIADAVTEFTYGHKLRAEVAERIALEHQGMFVHELRSLLHMATLAFQLIHTGKALAGGAVGAIVQRSHASLVSLIERSIVDVRKSAGMLPERHLVSLSEIVADVVASAALVAKARECTLTVSEIDPTLAISVDRETLSAAIGNLLGNAFKFTRHGTEVRMNTYASADRVLIEVSDQCGGLPSNDHEQMFSAFSQGGADRSGLGLGLAISRRSVEASGGTLTVRDLPGTGCTFTIDLPRHAAIPPSVTQPAHAP